MRSCLAAAVLLSACGDSSQLPGIDGWTGEPQVATKIEEARQEALANPRSAQATGRLGMIFQAHDLHTEAIVCYERAAELALSEFRWPYLAALSMRKNDLEAARGYFEEAANRGAATPAFHINYGDNLVQLGASEEAAAQYQKALAENPDLTHALYGLAQVAMAKGDVEQAREHLEHARKVAPWHGEVRTLLAQVYQRLERPEDSERELLAAGAYPAATQTADPIYQEVQLEAVTAQAYTKRGRQLARNGQFDQAEAQYRKVLEIREGTAGDYSNLGGALAGQNKMAEAVEQYQKALEIEPENPFALNNMAMAIARQGNFAEAVANLQKAVEIEPAYPEAHHNLGLLHAGQRQFEKAAQHYRDALTHNPSFTRAHNDLGSALANLGNLDGAIDHWRKALAIDGTELSALYNLSVALTRTGAHGEAIEMLRRGTEIAPDSSRLLSLLAWELATAPDDELRNGDEAATLAQRVYDAYPQQPGMGDVLAAALAEQGRFTTAIEVATKALEQARKGGMAQLVPKLEARLAGYQRNRPFRQPATG